MVVATLFFSLPMWCYVFVLVCAPMCYTSVLIVLPFLFATLDTEVEEVAVTGFIGEELDILEEYWSS